MIHNHLLKEHLNEKDKDQDVDGDVDCSLHATRRMTMEGQFDKFMDDLERRQKEQEERQKALQEAEKHWPVKKLSEKYREKPANRIVWSR